MKRFAAAGLLLALLPALAPAAPERPDTFISVQLENDFFAGTGDRYYTHGTQLSLLQATTPPDWLAALAERIPFYQAGSQLNLVNYTLGQKIFTPDDTVATARIPGDRPYAGYLYVSAAVLSQIGSNDSVDYGNLFELTLGVVGPSAMGKEIQTGFHDLIGIDSPRGWDTQLQDEPALGLSYSRFWRLVQPVSGQLELGISPHVTAAVGNVHTYGAGGIIFRVGHNLRRDLSPPNIRPGFPGLAYFRAGSTPGWYFYLGFESRLVARDLFLDGNTFKESHHVDKEPLVGDMQFGFVYLFDDLRIAFSNMLRTAEYRTQQTNTHYGAVNLSWRY